MTKIDNNIIDFITNYGWAMLVIIACVGALVYFGWPSNYQLCRDKCTELGAEYRSWNYNDNGSVVCSCAEPLHIHINITSNGVIE